MFDAPSSIYERIFKAVCDEFLAIGSYKSARNFNPEKGIVKPFRNVERGVPLEMTRTSSPNTYFPAAYLEWGLITEVKPYQSPSGFVYDLVVPLSVLTYLGENNAVFTGDTSGIGYGIGDLVTLVVEKFWSDHYPSRFTAARLPLEEDSAPVLPVHPSPVTDESLRDYCERLKKYDEALQGHQSDWWIIDFTVAVGDRIEPSPGEVARLANTPDIPNVRGTTIFYKFNVFERDALI